MQVHTFNQVPDLADYNKYATDPVLQTAVANWSSVQADERLMVYGARLGSSEVREWGDLANRYAPQLKRYTRLGDECNQVSFHSSWHRLMKLAVSHALHSRAWRSDQPGSHVERAAAFFMHGQVEAGSLCPLTMTSAALPILLQEAGFNHLENHLYSVHYDPRDIPIRYKKSITIGMGLTERQGGSDLSNTQTSAIPVSGAGTAMPYYLTGEKWFYSVPTADVHLVLARSTKGLSCFFVPRFKANEQPNAIRIRRLKDKLGNRSNATAEVEFHQAEGVMVGQEGKGLATLMRMASFTRLDCVLGSAALMREALIQALHHASHRQVFTKTLMTHPLMSNVLVDMAVESEASCLIAMRLAHALEQTVIDTKDTSLETALVRVVVPAAKFWITRRAQQLCAEGLEVWGGNGYIEDNVMPRLYREAPVNSIWEGSGNIMCLEMLKAMKREPTLVELLMDYLNRVLQDSSVTKTALSRLRAMLQASELERMASARRIAQHWVVLVQAALLDEYAPEFVSTQFKKRLFAVEEQSVFGLHTVSPYADLILARSWPYLV